MNSISQDLMKLHLALTVKQWDKVEDSFIDILRELPNFDRIKITHLALGIIEQCAREASFQMIQEYGIDPPTVNYPISSHWLDSRIDMSRRKTKKTRGANKKWTISKRIELYEHYMSMGLTQQEYVNKHAWRWGGLSRGTLSDTIAMVETYFN